MRRAVAGVVFACGVLTAAACSAPEFFRARRVERQDEAGSVHFALLAVAPWREYVDALQPRFEMTPEEALAAVVPATRMLQESIVDIVQATAGAATPQRTRSKTEIDVKGGGDIRSSSGSSGGGYAPEFDHSGIDVRDGGSQSQVTTETKEELPAFAPSGLVPSVRPIERPAATPGASRDFGEAALDPMTRYWAATALYQEVQLLNRYVRDAAVRDGCQAFVVRMQVSLMPAARGEPYDAYCTLGFFEGDRAGAPATSLRDPTKPDVRTTPQVIPLMVTDNLEAGMQSRALDSVRQMAGAIYAMSFSAGASADVQSMQETLQSVFGQDLNSLLTVGRVTDNTIRVRLGAQQQASSDFAMVPRSHNVTLLLLVPDGAAPVVDIVMRSTMVDAHTGVALPGRSEEEVNELLLETARGAGLQGVPPQVLMDLLGAAQRNDRGSFDRLLDAATGKSAAARALAPELWVDLVAAMAGGQYASTQFDLPRAVRARAAGEPPLSAGQTALLEDDGASARTTLRSSGLGSMSAIEATLHVPADGRELQIAAESWSIDEVQGTLTLHFPSLSRWGLVTGDARAVRSFRLVVTCEGKPIELVALHRVKSPGS